MPWPHPSTCDTCATPVLLARSRRSGFAYKLDPIEVLPPGSCGECNGRGRISFYAAMRGGRGQSNEPGDLYGRSRQWPTGGVCPVCWGAGKSGEVVPPDAIALDATCGVARIYTGKRDPWEALHHRHQCFPVRSNPGSPEGRRGRRPTAPRL